MLAGINMSLVVRELDTHMFDTAVNDNRVFSLVKGIFKSYSKIRLHHLGQEYTAKVVGVNVRKRLTKLVLFKG